MSLEPGKLNPSSIWRTGISRAGYSAPVIALMVAIYGPTLVGLFNEWWASPTQSQGLVIVPFAIVVAWLRRGFVTSVVPGRELRGLLLTGIACVMHLLGQAAAGNYVSQVSFVLLLAGIIWTFWGIGRLRALVLPLLLLFSAIPLPGLVYATLSMPLQLLASRVACHVAEFLGVAVFREGNIIHLATLSIGVWEACSGLNSLSALVAGAVLMGFVLCRLPLTRTVLCIAAVPVAVTANIVRITGTAVLSDRHPEYAMGFYHAFSGWLVFAVGTMCLYGTAVALRRLFEK
jgi:exosortase